jgi:hypothetical protein
MNYVFSKRFLYTSIVIHLLFIFFQIYLYSTYLEYTYGIQKHQTLQNELIQVEQKVEQELANVQNLETVKKEAESIWDMRQLDVSCIRKLSA